jgi:hypothetical protein
MDQSSTDFLKTTRGPVLLLGKPETVAMLPDSLCRMESKNKTRKTQKTNSNTKHANKNRLTLGLLELLQVLELFEWLPVVAGIATDSLANVFADFFADVFADFFADVFAGFSADFLADLSAAIFIDFVNFVDFADRLELRRSGFPGSASNRHRHHCGPRRREEQLPRQAYLVDRLARIGFHAVAFETAGLGMRRDMNKMRD